MLEVIEYHYAPLGYAGSNLQKKINGTPVEVNNWESFHKIMNEFLSLRQDNKITLTTTVHYGHILFNGHKGRVDIYQ